MQTFSVCTLVQAKLSVGSQVQFAAISSYLKVCNHIDLSNTVYHLPNDLLLVFISFSYYTWGIKDV